MRYSNRFQAAPRGINEKGHIVSGVPNDGTLCNPQRRSDNAEKRELGLTGSAYRKLIKRRRRELV